MTTDASVSTTTADAAANKLGGDLRRMGAADYARLFILFLGLHIATAICVYFAGPPSWELIGQTCLTEADAGELGALTPGMVRSAFRRLQWPAAELSVQPPDGETLVNLDTNFFTTLTDASTQTVTLVGITVEIEATPQEYHWHFGDGVDQSTTSPGAAYPHLEITHAYLRKGEVGASVDVVYGGRYRIGGSGGWTDIPGTLTVTGAPVGLTVLEAKPQLVG